MINHPIKLFFICLFIGIGLQAQETQKQFLLSSGGVGGNYNKTGNFIIEKLDSLYPSFGFRNIVSSGSLENLKLLDQRFSDLAISQRDVLLENIYSENKAIKNIQIILPLFQENLLIYKKNNPATASMEEFGKTMKSIGVSSKESVSYKTFLEVCRLLNIPDEFEVIEGNNNVLRHLIEKDSIDAIVSFSLPLVSIEELPNIEIQGFSSHEITLISNKINNIYPVTIEKFNIQTFGSWTFLVGLETSIIEIEENSKNGLAMDLFNSLGHEKNSIANQILKSIKFFANKKNQSLLYGLPLSASAKEVLSYNSYNLTSLLYILSSAILIIAFYLLFREKFLKINYRLYWIRYKHIFLGVLIILLLYILSVEGLLLSEKTFYKDLGIKSKILNLPKKDLHFWVIITNLTGNNNNIFPLSYSGQVLLSFSSYILFAGSITIALCEYIIYRLTKKRIKGMMDFNTKNHVVVIGWKTNTPQFLQELIVAQKSSHRTFQKIICIVENPEELISKSTVLKDLQALRHIDFVNGDAREEKVLSKANVQNANTVILLAEDNSVAADEKTLLRALTISRYCREMISNQEKVNSKKTIVYDEVFKIHNLKNSIYTIAEVNDKKYSEDLRKSGVNEIINISEYSKNILTQSLLNHGVSKVLDEVLTYNEFNEFYTIDLSHKKYSALLNKNYDQLLKILRNKNILLIGIKMVFHDTNNNEITDEAEIKKLLDKLNYPRQIIINPVINQERNKKTDNDDQLIVFCNKPEDFEKSF